MEFKKLKINALIPASYNPRKKLKPGDAEYEKIKNSITEFGYVDPIIVNSDMTIIGGHQRWSVLKALGYDEVDCVVIEIDKTKEKALNIALNKVTGKWNKELLADLIKDLQSLDYDVSMTGFEPPEIDELFNDVHSKETKEDDFDVDAELSKPTLTQKGDLWLWGRHRLVCGDATSPEVFDTLLDGKKVNLVVTDPPYNVNYSSDAGTIQNDNMADNDFYNFLLASYKNMANAMADDASIYVFHADTEGLNFRKAFVDVGFYLSGVCIWAKQSLVLGRSPYQWKHEPILFGWKKNGKHKWFADRKQSTIWNFDRPKKSELHPTMKPIALVAYPILNSSMTNGLVLDPFGGSGSTLIAVFPDLMDRKKCDIMKWTQTNPKSQEEIFMSIKKGTMPPRYDEAFKNGAIKMVTEQGRPSKEVAAELGICVETLKSWLKRAGFQPGATDRQNRIDKRQRELEAEIRSLRKQLAEKDVVIDVLKKSVGIFSKL